MATTASGSGSEQGDTTSPGAADDALSPAAPGAVVQPPRVTLTIEFGTLSMESISAISEFVKTALSAGPAMAIGRASGNVGISSVSKPTKAHEGGGS